MAPPFREDDHVACAENLSPFFGLTLSDPLEDHDDFLDCVHMPGNTTAGIDDVLMDGRLLGAKGLVGEIATQPSVGALGDFPRRFLSTGIR